MKKIIFFNHKGGVGKSTLTRTIAEILSKDNKVLIIDLDEQNSIANNFNLKEKIHKAFNQDKLAPIWIYLSGFLQKEKILYPIHANLDLVVNSSNDTLRINYSQNTNRFNKNFEKLASEYDYVFFDLPPNIDNTLISILHIIDEIYLVLDCEKDSSTSAKLLASYLGDQDIDTRKIKATIPNKYLYIHKREHDKVIDDFTLDLDKTVETLNPIKNKIAIKDKDRLAEYEEDFAEIIKLIKKGNK